MREDRLSGIRSPLWFRISTQTVRGSRFTAKSPTVCRVLEWEEFRPIRVALSQAYRGKLTRALATQEGEKDMKASETCTMEALNEIMWTEEAYRMSSAEREEEVKAVQSSEAKAKELLGQDALTYEAVWQVVQSARLRGQRTKRDRLLEDQDPGSRVQMWVFGMYCHGGITGLTSLTRERPFLTRLLVRLIRQELPDLSFTTVSLAIDSTLKPHRDLANAVNSRAGIVGISEFHGGRLWFEHPDGTVKRRISVDKIKVGKLLEISQQAQTFDPRQWHGADKHRGVRATVTAYTARQLHSLDRDLIEELQTLEFSLPDNGPIRQACQASSSSGSTSIHPPPSTSPATFEHNLQQASSPKPQIQLDDDEMMFGYAGFMGSGSSGRCEGCGVVLGEGKEPVSVPPWIGNHAEEAEPNSSFSEAAQKRAAELLQRKCSQGLYERHCPDCAEAHGHKRKCRRISPEDVGKGTLSMDLSGPHPASFSGHRYFLVANLSMQEGDDIPFSRLLKTKTTEEVARALTSVMCQIVSLAQGTPPVFRIHSDAGKEFIGGSFQKEVEACCLWPTMSAPYTPQQNGKAERLVGLIKGAAGAVLLHAQLPLQLWSEAVLEATFLRRCRSLKLLIPKDRPRMGDSVLIRKPQVPAEHAFAPRAEEGIFLANDERTPGGARIMVIRDGNTSVRVARLPVLKDRSLPRWKLERGPDGQVVWLSTHGDIKWQAPPEDLLTVEETRGEVQPWNAGNAAADLIRARFKHHMQPELLFSLFGHGFMVDPGDVAVAPEAATAATAEGVERSDAKDRYYILSYKAEKDMLQSEAEPHRVTIAEDEDASVFTRQGVEGWEHEKWVHGLTKELDNMKTKGVLIEVGDDMYPDVRPVPSKLVLRKKPIQDCKVEETKGVGAAEMAELIKRAWDPRVRLVACGNFERGTKSGDPANYSANPGPDMTRILISLLARNRKTWTALVLDISCAFLNAPLDTSENKNPVLIQPPSILYRLGLISRGVIWRAARAIYGLRKSPKLWEQERNSELNDAQLLPDSQDQLGILTLQEVTSGFWIVRDHKGNLVGGMMMYVDDAIITGQSELIRRVHRLLCSLWDLKVQGILNNKHIGLVSGQDFELDNGSTTVTDELTYLGFQIQPCDSGVAVHQQNWLDAEMKKRAWLNLQGVDSLPEVDEGKWPPVEKDAGYRAALKECQSEIGSLQWAALRSRPDVSAVVGTLATMMTVDPVKVLALSKRVWRYLKGTFAVKLLHKYCDNLTDKIHCYGDASFATGASRSRSGTWICFGEHVLSWKSKRQTICAWSAFEAELDAAATTSQTGVHIQRTLEGMLNKKLEMILYSDNAACVINLVRDDGECITARTRAVGIRCSYLRDQCVMEGFNIQNMSGSELPADPLTKILRRTELVNARSKLGLLVI